LGEKEAEKKRAERGVIALPERGHDILTICYRYQIWRLSLGLASDLVDTDAKSVIDIKIKRGPLAVFQEEGSCFLWKMMRIRKTAKPRARIVRL
jgi:hypothetical protein